MESSLFQGDWKNGRSYTFHFTKDGLKDKCLSFPRPLGPHLPTTVMKQRKVELVCWASLSHVPNMRCTVCRRSPVSWVHLTFKPPEKVLSFHTQIGIMEEIKFVLRCLLDVGLWRLSYQAWCLHISRTHLADDPPTFDDALTDRGGQSPRRLDHI